MTTLAGSAVDASSFDWQDDGLCRTDKSIDIRIWFYEDHFASASKEYRRAQASAKAVCERCPMRRPCLVFAIRNNEAAGIWGGFTTEERKDLRGKYG